MRFPRTLTEDCVIKQFLVVARHFADCMRQLLLDRELYRMNLSVYGVRLAIDVKSWVRASNQFFRALREAVQRSIMTAGAQCPFPKAVRNPARSV